MEKPKGSGRPRGREYPNKVPCYLGDEDLRRLRLLARVEDRPVAAVIRQLIRRELEARGVR